MKFQESRLIFSLTLILNILLSALAYQNEVEQHQNRIRHQHKKELCRVRRVFNGEFERKPVDAVVSMEHKPLWWFMDYEHVCGGVLISSQWAVSSAHCFKG